MMLATVEAKLKALQALPTAASIKPSFEPIVKALAEAKAKDKSHDEVAALAALRRGNDAVAAAEQAHRDRSEFDGLAVDLAGDDHRPHRRQGEEGAHQGARRGEEARRQAALRRRQGGAAGRSR